jgi:hypothetical protein
MPDFRRLETSKTSFHGWGEKHERPTKMKKEDLVVVRNLSWESREKEILSLLCLKSEFQLRMVIHHRQGLGSFGLGGKEKSEEPSNPVRTPAAEFGFWVW